MFELVIWGLALLILVVGATAGWFGERRHLVALAEREPLVAGIMVTDLRSIPPGVEALSGELVVGQVVLGADRGKQFVGGLRNVLGGEVRSFQKILLRARREARLRMLEDARDLGADLVVNVRMRAGHVRPHKPTSVDWFDAILIVAAVAVVVLCVIALVTLSDPPAPPG